MKLLPLASGMLLATGAVAAPQKDLTLNDIMKFESLKKPVLSDNGQLLAVEAAPDRGDSRTLVRMPGSDRSFELAGASNPKVSADGRFVAAEIEPTLFERETASKKEKKKLKDGMVLLDTQTGKELRFERVKSFSFSDDGRLLAIEFEAEEESKDKADNADTQTESNAVAGAEAKAGKKDKQSKPEVDKADKGAPFTLIVLGTGKQYQFEDVTGFALSKAGGKAAVAINDVEAGKHAIQLYDIGADKLIDLKVKAGEQIGDLALSDDGKYLAHTSGRAARDIDEREYQLTLTTLASGKQQLVANSDEWTLNRYSELDFSPDNLRLFFGRVPQINKPETLSKYENEADLYNTAVITDQRNLKIWHGDDPRIKPHEIKQYDKEVKRTYQAVMHLGSGQVVQLADETVPDLELGPQSRYLVASSDLPYRKMITWAGFYRDFYLVDLNTGRKQLVLTQQPSRSGPSLSPDGKFLAYFQQGNVYLHDIAANSRRELSAGIATPFADEDHDYPSQAPGYGFGPWLDDDEGVLVYDKYDVWQFDTTSGKGFMLTDGKGRETGVQYRVTGLSADRDEPAAPDNGDKVMLHGYSHKTKGDGFYGARLGSAGVDVLMQGDYKLKLLSRADDADTLVYSKEQYNQFPDLYTADYLKPEQGQRQTHLDEQRDGFDWSQSELVSWTNGDGRQLDGVLIKPNNYEEGKRYPVLVYYYRFMSDRLHSFPAMKVNHRPNFAWYADNGYAIFLPDIRFEIGYPGPAAVQALTSGVQHIIDMGVADPKAIGLHGHSWSGYQTAFAITQTHMFKAAVSGAPVSNMTSAFSGIRHGSGLARQFQYETGQSRIGESLMAAPHKYIENSPVFYAERIKTPMMIMFGDKDDAVPWEQGIEMYLAMRRAGKDVVFLQYEDEPHHLKKYPNKVDYSIRMMEYFDHYLKGTPAPEWIKAGEAYREYDKD
ncbi:prolyl oligopeptidase family serine peptidase [Shewanella corallii]|uniref:Prolyl oligopeptidase family serine peptidase n=1 Tax=Shewanella corallii TaxID=560080 RepID=A0ABT0NAM2_9GAMM|nr:prolyl oligopeptidase family serine peptidase [Shewanella corallii]MCL2915392.1 prolyl oligopeptidase family serine peptidase [Shewanella corallii]